MDVEKTIQFILEQQAQFSSDIQLIMEALRNHQEHFGTSLIDLANSQGRTNEIVAALAERHVDLAEQHKVTEQSLNALEQALNALITTVERHIANH
ncbi:MAG TPA: hypothetical protein VJX67_00845 [Blastocatellia bacterium]|nr:hypothetical protein [Blastocatellia bacterium]